MTTSSFVLSGAARALVKTDGSDVPFASMLKSAVVPTTPVVTLAGLSASSVAAAVLALVTRTGERIQYKAAPYGSYAPTDSVLVAPTLGVFDMLGADRQPVQLVAVPASTLSP